MVHSLDLGLESAVHINEMCLAHHLRALQLFTSQLYVIFLPI
jgi:hypothetical protein